MLVKTATFTGMIIYHVLIIRIYYKFDFLYNYILVKTATFTGIIIYHELINRMYY